ncbi:transglycosylase SLT domain-containing protein [Gymnodinialimonas hymeniacidonis]|uniref:transglycosylase SLT domain-containing protein n=1 Tax=Gymnodinialimonas hymeniacidonis TaxID=3126508 RepID=UPI0034C5B689
MGALRLICLLGGLSAVLVTTPGKGFAQADASVGVEVTSGVIDDDVALDRPELAEGDLTVAPHILIEEDAVSALAPAISLRPVVRDTWAIPSARWDDHPNGARWTAAVLSALRGPGAPLLEVEPRDIHAWCPGYIQASPAQRAAFWTGLISTLAWHESTHRPSAVGGGGRWFGLVQIAPGTARWRDCDVQSGQALLDGSANLRCGIRIMGITVPRDQVVSEGMRGVAADWGPFHSQRKREDMRQWVRGQDYCQLPPSPTRPVMRPANLGQAPETEMAPVSGPSIGLDTRPVLRPEAA